MNGQWFKIKGYRYTGPDTVEFFEPFEPPVQPLTWHFFRCTEVSSGNPKTPEDEGKFEPVGVGKLEKTGIKALTEAKVNSGEWFWQARKKP